MTVGMVYCRKFSFGGICNGTEKTLFEQLDGTYHKESGYLIPDLRLQEEEERTIGIFGQRHLRYLREYRKVTYTNLLTSGRLNVYLAEIDRQAQERL